MVVSRSLWLAALATLSVLSVFASSACALDRQALERLKAATVTILPQLPPAQRNMDEPEGTGFAVGDGGVIVTADHVLGRTNAVLLRLPGGSVIDGDILVRDAETDLATIRISQQLQTLDFAADYAEGDRVCAYGNAFGLGPSLSCGVISAVARSGVGFNRIEDFVQTDAPINPGMSGAPLVDDEGRLVGAVSAIFTKGRDGDLGVNFAVSAHLLTAVLADVRDGTIDRERQGLLLRSEPAPGETGRAGGRIMRIETGGREAGSALEAGDLVTAINGRAVTSQAGYLAALALSPKTEMVFTIERAGETLTISVPPK